MQYQNILSQNIYSPNFKPKFLLMGECLENSNNLKLKTFLEHWQNIFIICLEKFHYNQLMAKLSGILALGKTKEIAFLTPDGSPHCVQVHFSSKYLKRIIKYQVKFQHFVVDKQGDIWKIQKKAIDNSRKFALLDSSERFQD